MSSERVKTALIACCAFAWLVAACGGLSAMWVYASTPGPAAAAIDNWPAESRLARDPHRPTLVMFAHPQCGCSRATIGELAILMAHVQGQVTVHVLIYRPSDADAGWERTELWNDAAAIPGVTVASDEDATVATQFGALVSGQTLFYDATGRLKFSGGITAARGHSGDNTGRSVLTTLLTGGTPDLTPTPVFGCLLRPAPVS